MIRYADALGAIGLGATDSDFDTVRVRNQESKRIALTGDFAAAQRHFKATLDFWNAFTPDEKRASGLSDGLTFTMQVVQGDPAALQRAAAEAGVAFRGQQALRAGQIEANRLSSFTGMMKTTGEEAAKDVKDTLSKAADTVSKAIEESTAVKVALVAGGAYLAWRFVKRRKRGAR